MKSDWQKEPLPTRDQCRLHNEALNRLEQEVTMIRIAVCGDEKMGVKGLVSEMRTMKDWRYRMEIRVAGISGGVAVIVLAAKYFITKL